jgi:hypothetical protein
MTGAALFRPIGDSQECCQSDYVRKHHLLEILVRRLMKEAGDGGRDSYRAMCRNPLGYESLATPPQVVEGRGTHWASVEEMCVR